SANISGWRWFRAARRGTARVPSPPIRCAAASARWRSSATTSSILKEPACMANRSMVERLSPLAPVYRPGPHGNFEHGVGVARSEVAQAAIVQVAAWPGAEKKVIDAIRKVTGLAVADGAGAGIAEGGRAAFGIAPGKFLVSDETDDL